MVTYKLGQTLSAEVQSAAKGAHLRRLLDPSSSNARRTSPDDARAGPMVPHLMQRAAYPPSADSMTMGATWPHRSGRTGVNDIFLAPLPHTATFASHTPPWPASSARGRYRRGGPLGRVALFYGRRGQKSSPEPVAAIEDGPVEAVVT